eukprot:2096508-Pleurochrysis_carterae.AAC.1
MTTVYKPETSTVVIVYSHAKGCTGKVRSAVRAGGSIPRSRFRAGSGRSDGKSRVCARAFSKLPLQSGLERRKGEG